MISSPTMPRNSPARNRTVRVSEDAWRSVVRIAEALGCTTSNGVKGETPSVGVLLAQIAEGALILVRAKEPTSTSKAARIRAAIKADPTATNRQIADRLGLAGKAGLQLVTIERRRARLKAEQAERQGG